MRAKKFLSSRQIFRYAVPTRTVTKKALVVTDHTIAMNIIHSTHSAGYKQEQKLVVQCPAYNVNELAITTSNWIKINYINITYMIT